MGAPGAFSLDGFEQEQEVKTKFVALKGRQQGFEP